MGANLEQVEHCEKDGKYFDIVNCTINALESHNRHFNHLFPNRPMLIAFVQAVEKESQFQAQILSNIRTGKLAEPCRSMVQSIPVIPQ